MVYLMKSVIFLKVSESLVFECQNTKIGVLICEDQWVDDPIREAL